MKALPMIALLLVSGVAISAANPATTSKDEINSQLGKANAFYLQQNYPEANRIWTSLADSGVVKAQLRLGSMNKKAMSDA
jgi:hypothetical protein